MIRNFIVLAAAAAIVALPFVFRREEVLTGWRAGDPELVIVTSHNEAIRFEFGHAFSRWHQERFGRPVKIDWRAIGGTSEIMRYLEGEYVSAYRAWTRRQGDDWPPAGASWMLDRKFKPDAPPPETATNAAARAEWEQRVKLWSSFRNIDDPEEFSCRIDLLFGGGEYDHSNAARQGLLVPAWPPGKIPSGLVETAGGQSLIPETLSGERWRTPIVFGNAVSTFGICYNLDRIRDLNLPHPPRRWRDLADPRYFGQLGVADPTKSSSLNKAFEMMIHQVCREAVEAAGYGAAAIDAIEREAGVKEPPADYQAAIERGWEEGVRLVQLIGANARYFAVASGKVPIDVSMGDAAAGVAIDFYGRFQAEQSRRPDGTERMVYVTPEGGSSVSPDPISLLRGAPRRELAVRFIEFVLSPEGQQLWNYRPGEPGGPIRFALRRLPIRRDFYPSPDLGDAWRERTAHSADPLDRPDVNPYEIAKTFTYYPRWTANHFGVHRDLVRAMCLDAGEELRAAWKAIIDHGGPEAQPEAMARLGALPDVPEPLNWRSAPGLVKRHDTMDYMRDWILFFRRQYEEARRIAEGGGAS